jgi:hypothetical protein
MQTETFSNVPIHGEFLLIVGLDWTILRETLDNFYGTVKLSVDKLMRVHGLFKDKYRAQGVGREFERSRETGKDGSRHW